MMDGKMAAIAITIIVAVPILLGYAMAFEEEEITGYNTTDTVNVTDYTLNSTYPIYTTSYSPMNNQQLKATVYWTNQAVTETSIISPGFNSVGAVSSIPIIAYGGYTQTLAAMSSSLNSSTATLNSPATYPYACLDPVSTTGIAEFELDGTLYGDSLAAGLSVEFCATGDGSEWTTYYNGEKTGSEIVSYGNTYPVLVQTRAYTTLSPVDPDSNAISSYYVTIPSTASVQLTYSDSTTESFYVSANSQLVKNGTNLTLGDDVYSNVTSVALATAYGTNSVVCLYSYETGTYADPSYGWTLTADQGIITMPAYWFNNSLNESVTMMLDMPVSTTSVLTPGASYNAAYSVTVSRSSDGTVTVSDTDESYTLGKYQYLSVTVDGDTVSVSGIAAWTNMRSNPVLINTVTVTNYGPETFAGIWLGGSSTVSYRVDSASVYSGTFAITENYTLDMTALWPSSDFTVKMSTVGIYGDTVTFAGTDYTVTDGAITVDGSEVRLLNCVFSSIYDSDSSTWSNRINGSEISTSASPSTIYFGGEWSMTLTAYRMEEVTKSELRWQAGEFAWNGVDENFALMGLMASAAAFIGLGMYGRRSGAKVGTLMIICGCAAFVFLALM